MENLEALTTGSLLGVLSSQDVLDVTVWPVTDDEGNYLPELLVQANQSGAVIRITIEALTEEEYVAYEFEDMNDGGE